MFRCLVLVLVGTLTAVSLFGAEPDPKPGPTIGAPELREAVQRSLPLLQQGAIGHREHRTCFACHNQGIPAIALTLARQRGFEIDDEELATQLKFIAEFLGRNRESYLQGKGQGGQVDTAGYALLTLEVGGWQPDEITSAVTQYLLLYQSDADHWRVGANRPPSEASRFTTSYVALRGLAAFGTPEQQDQIALRTEQVRGWLLRTEPKDNEDRVFRLLGLYASKYRDAGAPAEPELAAAAEELLSRQRADGGWSQLDASEADYDQSDAYATGTALVALHQAGGLATTEAAYQRGLRFLLDAQHDDGSWHVVSRSKPFQAYFESGFPHGKDQFISCAASGWATTAILLALPR